MFSDLNYLYIYYCLTINTNYKCLTIIKLRNSYNLFIKK